VNSDDDLYVWRETYVTHARLICLTCDDLYVWRGTYVTYVTYVTYARLICLTCDVCDSCTSYMFDVWRLICLTCDVCDVCTTYMFDVRRMTCVRHTSNIYLLWWQVVMLLSKLRQLTRRHTLVKAVDRETTCIRVHGWVRGCCVLSRTRLAMGVTTTCSLPKLSGFCKRAPWKQGSDSNEPWKCMELFTCNWKARAFHVHVKAAHECVQLSLIAWIMALELELFTYTWKLHTSVCSCLWMPESWHRNGLLVRMRVCSYLSMSVCSCLSMSVCIYLSTSECIMAQQWLTLVTHT